MFLKNVVASVLAVSFTFVNPCAEPAPQEDRRPEQNLTVFEVKTIMPTFVSVPKSHTEIGALLPSEEAWIKAPFATKVDQFLVNEGDTVQKSDPLLILNGDELQNSLDLKKARLRELQAKLAELQKGMAVDGGPSMALHPEDSQFLDEQPAEDIPTDGPAFGDTTPLPEAPGTLLAMAEVLQAQQDRVKKSIEQLEHKLLQLTVPSPFQGVVTNIPVTAGNMIQPQENLLQLSQVHPMSVEFRVPQTMATAISKNTPVDILDPQNSAAKTNGTVYFISPNLDPVTQSLAIRAHVQNNDGLFKGGQKVQVAVHSQQSDRVIIVPPSALVQQNGQSFVFIVLGDKAKAVSVTPGSTMEDGRVQIYGDLRVDDPIIIERPEALDHDAFVKDIPVQNQDSSPQH